MRPKLVPRNILSAKMIGKHYSAEIDPNFQKKMYDAQCRLAGRPVTDVFNAAKTRRSLAREPTNAVIMDLFFTEFKPHFEIGTASVSYADLAVPERMYHCLVTDELLLMVIQNALMYQQFTNWTSLIFRHKFQNYDETQQHRYKFILDKCNFFARIMTVSVPSVDDWLPDYLMTWDGVLFREEIFEMISHMNFLDFEDGYMCILDNFERQFVDGNLCERLEIWKLFEKLYMFWVDMITKNGSVQMENSEGDRTECDIVNTLYNFMCQLLNVYTASIGKGEPVLLYVVCDTFTQLLDNYKAQPGLLAPIPPIVLWFQVLTTNSYRMLDTFCYIARTSAKHAGKAIPLYIEFCKFFEPLGAGLSYLFGPELEFIEEEKEKEGEGSATESTSEAEGAVGGATGGVDDLYTLQELEEKINQFVELNCFNCLCLQPFRVFKMGADGGVEAIIFKFGNLEVAPKLIEVLQKAKLTVEIGYEEGEGGTAGEGNGGNSAMN